MSKLKASEYKRFEDIKIIRADRSEYWLARELSPVLGYSKWENFSKVIDRAMLACRNSGFEIADHFPDIRKMVDIGSRTKRRVKDFELSRYACYLIVQNGDPRKEVIAFGQTYFAIQTYRQEVADRFNQLDEDNKRLVIRGDIKQWNQMLAEAARDAGVITNEEFAVFQNAGYMGLYGGLSVEKIHDKKGLAVRDKILDYMGSEELIANLFRISQTDCIYLLTQESYLRSVPAFTFLSAVCPIGCGNGFLVDSRFRIRSGSGLELSVCPRIDVNR